MKQVICLIAAGIVAGCATTAAASPGEREHHGRYENEHHERYERFHHDRRGYRHERRGRHDARDGRRHGHDRSSRRQRKSEK